MTLTTVGSIGSELFDATVSVSTTSLGVDSAPSPGRSFMRTCYALNLKMT